MTDHMYVLTIQNFMLLLKLKFVRIPLIFPKFAFAIAILALISPSHLPPSPTTV
jgi:hypothetical protein